MLILGSSSVARLELLSSVGLAPDRIEKPVVDESLKQHETHQNYVRRIAKEKALSITTSDTDFLIAADTIVTKGRNILRSTDDGIQAREYLKSLSGRRHNVFTAFCIKHNGLLNLNLVKTSLKMRLLTEKEINEYIASKELIHKCLLR